MWMHCGKKPASGSLRLSLDVKGNNHLTWLVALLTICLGAVAWVFGQIGLEQSKRGEVCVRCGAERTQSKRSFRLFSARVPLANSSKIKSTTLTKCWSQYALPCVHDLSLRYINTRTPSASSFADAFPSFRYPVASATAAETLAAEIEWLDVPNARSNALNAIGNRDNLLRFVAAMALSERAQSKQQPSAWWVMNEKYFVVVTNRQLATTLLDAWEPDAPGLLSYGIEKSRECVNQPR
jgi:hypothetical protein